MNFIGSVLGWKQQNKLGRRVLNSSLNRLHSCQDIWETRLLKLQRWTARTTSEEHLTRRPLPTHTGPCRKPPYHPGDQMLDSSSHRYSEFSASPAAVHSLFQLLSPDFPLRLLEPRWGVHTTGQGGGESKNQDFAASAVRDKPFLTELTKQRLYKT